MAPITIGMPFAKMNADRGIPFKRGATDRHDRIGVDLERIGRVLALLVVAADGDHQLVLARLALELLHLATELQHRTGAIAARVMAGAVRTSSVGYSRSSIWIIDTFSTAFSWKPVLLQCCERSFDRLFNRLGRTTDQLLERATVVEQVAAGSARVGAREDVGHEARQSRLHERPRASLPR